MTSEDWTLMADRYPLSTLSTSLAIKPYATFRASRQLNGTVAERVKARQRTHAVVTGYVTGTCAECARESEHTGFNLFKINLRAFAGFWISSTSKKKKGRQCRHIEILISFHLL
ncbi:hypothetical protein EYF80_039879 [Liparis tanakae]|uniref:Uncharacterized protein n=1 Tax=Liparis tanakae TaxID=230148 RepID=A0A4Z2GBD7_9TELE|nr:hypothetical protein EYF80_039879 [Liparis tanakae]